MNNTEQIVNYIEGGGASFIYSSSMNEALQWQWRVQNKIGGTPAVLCE